MQTTISEEVQTVLNRIRGYDLAPLRNDLPIEINVDGMCENPGPMEVGLYGRQGDCVIFAEHVVVGQGTCNEAEYIAVKLGLTIVKALFPNPGVPVKVYSDSQLVVHQVNQNWNVKNLNLRSYRSFLSKLRREFPFELIQIPREQNIIADMLAQTYNSKHSGRFLSLDAGRFQRTKAGSAVIQSSGIYKAFTSNEFRSYLEKGNLYQEILELEQLANGEDPDRALEYTRVVERKAVELLRQAPKTNRVVAQWTETTLGLIPQAFEHIRAAIMNGDVIEAHYVLDEIMGRPTQLSELHEHTLANMPELGFATPDGEKAATAADFEEEFA